MSESSALRRDPPVVPFRSPDDKSATRSKTSADPISPTVKTEVSTAVLSVSAGMVGVCLTSIGILKLVVMHKNALGQWCDDLLAVTSLIFLCASIVSFQVIKSPVGRRKCRLASVADTLFVIGLVVMVVVCALLTWTVVGLTGP